VGTNGFVCENTETELRTASVKIKIRPRLVMTFVLGKLVKFEGRISSSPHPHNLLHQVQ